MQLVGPLQSWGVGDRFRHRTTGAEPSKSGIVGLLANALGRTRSDDITDLAALRVGVRSDVPGKVLVDFHTAFGHTVKTKVVKAGGQVDVQVELPRNANAEVTHRHYLTDAKFLAGVEADEPTCRRLLGALRHPARDLYLGRRACAPSLPIGVGIVDQTLEEFLNTYPPLADGVVTARWSRDAKPGEHHDIVRDQPVTFDAAHHMYATRAIARGFTTFAGGPEPGTADEPAGDHVDPFDAV